MNKFFILGPMPQGALPQTHYAAGPWCFSGQEESFPGWEKGFIFAPEPLSDPSLLPLAASWAKNLCIRLLPLAARELFKNPENLPLSYWQTLLAPFCITFASQIVERWLRAKAAIHAWESQLLTVPLLRDEIDFSFVDENDYNLRGTLGITYNWWLFSRLFEISWPVQWEKVYTSPSISKPVFKSPTVKKRIWQWLREISLAMPFPRLKGMGIFQSLFFSLALLHECRTLNQAFSLEKIFTKNDLPDDFPKLDDITPLLKKTIPASLKNLSHPQRIKFQKSQRLHIASIAAYENCSYRKSLATWKAAGNRLGWVQHGGNYGLAKVVCNSSLVEYADSVFFTWGWSAHGETRGNFRPMPYPQLQKIRDKWHCASDKYIFVGAEMACFGYRLESRPTPLQFVKYRDDKLLFLEGCPANIRQKIAYRPYFRLPGLLEDGPFIQKHFPEINICAGSLLPQILACQLLVLDHHGTTMLEAFAANIPMILFWDVSSWPITGKGKEMLNLLEEAEIWHSTPEKAAKKFTAVSADPGAWWNSESVQKIRKEYCKFQAWTIKSGINSCWFKTLFHL